PTPVCDIDNNTCIECLGGADCSEPNSECAEKECVCLYEKCGVSCCAEGETCFAGECCSPKTCDELGVECGSYYSGNCGISLDCGSCLEHKNSYCDEGKCKCFSDTCVTLGFDCGGPYDNNCGGTIDCGGCSEGWTCESGICSYPDDGGVSDTGEDAGTDDGGVSDSGVQDTGGGLEGEPANITLPAPSVSAPVRMDVQEGTHPSVFYTADKSFLFYNDIDQTQPDERLLYLRRANIGTADFEPQRIVNNSDCYGVDMIKDGTEYKITTAAGPVMLLFKSQNNGDSWQFIKSFYSSDGACGTNYTSYFFRPVMPELKIAVSFSYRSLFGCVDQMHYISFKDGNWSADKKISGGVPSGAYEMPGKLTAGSSFGVFYSEDNGGIWTEVKGGDLTKYQIEGTAMRMDDQNRLYLVQTYGYANKEYLALLISEDGGVTWNRKIILDESNYIIVEPIMDISGGDIVVTWRKSKDGRIQGSYYHYDAFAMYSKDYAESWSPPLDISENPDDRNLGGLAVAARNGEASIAYSETGDGIAWDFKGVYYIKINW
ncbi:MAG: sialidase family protein, partial [Phycisphaerae bacterium]|nr:sialidase family protein [Phycisphaerae bacterium]